LDVRVMDVMADGLEALNDAAARQAAHTMADLGVC
jgi:hypothetical protein